METSPLFCAIIFPAHEVLPVKSNMVDESSEFREKECFEIFKEVLGRKLAVRHWNDVYLGILAVDCGLKISYLVDQCHIKPAHMNKLITNLRREKFLSEVELHAVVIHGDIFVLQKENTLKYLNRISNEQSVCFVDVSQGLNEPNLIPNSDEKLWTSINTFCSRFTDFLQRCPIDTQNSDERESTSFEFEDDIIHPCTVFGLILGYPIVYSLTKESEINCLSGIDLSVCSSELTLAPWQAKSDNFVTVSSFSFPENFATHCEKYVESWSKSACAISQKQTMLVHRIMCKKVRWPVVIL